MELKVGDKLRHPKIYGGFEVIRSNDLHAFLSSYDSGFSIPIKHLEALGFEKVRDIPKDGELVVIWNIYSDIAKIRVSSGQVDENGDLLCYDDGFFTGKTFAYHRWEPYNPNKRYK